MNTDTLPTPLLTLSELCDASGAPAVQIESWVRRGVLVPARESRGSGTLRGFDTENVITATQLYDLSRAGLSSPQTRRILAKQNAELVDLPPNARIVRRHEHYIQTVVVLAQVFGRGPGHDEWLATQQAQLHRMKAALGPSGTTSRRTRGVEYSELLHKLVVASKGRHNAASPIAG